MVNLELRCVSLACFFVVRVRSLLEVKLVEASKEILIVATSRSLVIQELEERRLSDVFRLKEFQASNTAICEVDSCNCLIA